MVFDGLFVVFIFATLFSFMFRLLHNWIEGTRILYRVQALAVIVGSCVPTLIDLVLVDAGFIAFESGVRGVFDSLAGSLGGWLTSVVEMEGFGFVNFLTQLVTYSILTCFIYPMIHVITMLFTRSFFFGGASLPKKEAEAPFWVNQLYVFAGLVCSIMVSLSTVSVMLLL